MRRTARALATARAATAAMTLTGCRIAKAIGFRDEFTASSSPSKASAI